MSTNMPLETHSSPLPISVFRETSVVARRCDGRLIPRLGMHAGNIVTVTEDTLSIVPTRLGRFFGLDQQIPLLKIHLMERLAGPKANIRLEYTGEDGWCRCLEMRLRNPGAFVDAVREGQWEAIT
ncbi:hypothetical protein [Fimbriimonas ginsengisoli]|uniref:Uncharacterized protein n=1 Tax=Fimbriimonas ginsengisoli Gsoil 348 TaxID=661478 RepID=A0A068NN62_FIMGI|nr:hypothetical protein [Fimbriimonas ginsengisoli]AIE84993.1 hypothetical protein OP10G_1625 [Fimbriimonas ginsengisoli Gsoil 348]